MNRTNFACKIAYGAWNIATIFVIQSDKGHKGHEGHEGHEQAQKIPDAH